MTRHDLLRFAIDYWDAATADSQSETDRAIARALLTMYRDRGIRDADDPPSRVNMRRQPTAVFSASRNALWFNHAALRRWADGKAIAHTLPADDHKPAITWFYGSKETFARPTNAILERRENEKLWQTGDRKYAGIRRGSILVHGMDNMITWIGARTPDEIRVTLERHENLHRSGIERFTDLAALLRELSDEQRAALLQEPLVDVRDVLLSGTKLVHPGSKELASNIGIALGQSDLTVVNGGLRVHEGKESGIDFVVVKPMIERLKERDIDSTERILTILPGDRDQNQDYLVFGAKLVGPNANTEERRAMFLDHCRIVLTIDGGSGSRAIAAFAFSRRPHRIPVLPVVATGGIESAALEYWQRHQQLIRDDFSLSEDDVRALSIPGRRRDDQALAARVVRILRHKAMK